MSSVANLQRSDNIKIKGLKNLPYTNRKGLKS